MGLESDLQLHQPVLKVVVPDIILVENKEGRNEGNEDYADSALRAWSTVAGAFLLQFYSVGLWSAFGIFQEFYTTSWLSNYSASDISWIGGVQSFFQLACAVIGGKLFDAGYVRTSIFFGSLLSSFSFFMLSLVKQNQYYQVFLAQSLGMGLGLCLIYLPTLTLVSQHTRKHRAFAMGIAGASGPLGAITFSIMLNHLIRSIGFAWAVRATAFISLGCFFLGNALIVIPHTPIPPSQPHSRPTQPTIPAKLETWDIPYILTLTSAFVFSLGSNTPPFYLQLFAESKDVTKTLVVNCVAMSNAGSIVGRIISSRLADKFGAINIFIPVIAIAGLVQCAMLGAGSPVGLVLFALCYGFLFGSILSLYLPMIADISFDGSDMGQRMGIALAPIGIASLIGPPITGAILGKHYVWWKPIVFSSVVMVAAAGFNLAARQIHRGRMASLARLNVL